MKVKSQILKPILSYWMVLFLISLFALQAVAASAKNSVPLGGTIPEEVQKAAESNLQIVGNYFLNDTDSVRLEDANITVQDMKLGPGFKINVVTGENVKNGSNKKLSSIIADTSGSDEWLFVIEANDKQIGMMEIGYENQKYTLVGYGGLDDNFLATAKQLIQKYGKDNVALLQFRTGYFFAYQDQNEIKVQAVDEDVQKSLESYATGNEPTLNTFATAVNASIAYDQKMQEKSTEQLYGTPTLYSAEETGYTESEKSSVGLWIGIAALIVVAVGGTVGIVFAVRKKRAAK